MVKIKEKKQRIIGLKEFRLNTEEYIKKLRKGQSFTVVRRSSPVFNLTPVDDDDDEHLWHTVLDFSKTKRGSMPMEDFLKVLKKFNEKHR